MCADVTARSVRWRLRLAFAFACSQPLYWLHIFPQARRELRRWALLADAIPDPALRRLAMHKLETEHLTAEGAAAFAILAAAPTRRHVVRLCVAFEVLFDFLDGVAEQPVEDVLANNRRLYRALGAALAPAAPLENYYAFNSQWDDAGYMARLIETCRQSLTRLVSHHRVLPALQRLAARAGEAQSLHHAGSSSGRALEEWARAQRSLGLRWWEIAAAAGSPLGIFALVATGSREHVSERDVLDVERAYFPWIAALSWLLESLVDLGEDLETGVPSYVLYYHSPEDAAGRLALIAARAADDIACLPRGPYHAALFAGMVSMNLSHPGAAHEAAREAATAVERTVGGPVGPLIAVLRLRRRLSARSGAGRAVPAGG
jgi:tetraprenyl-beta-curcumene synthase